jgi:hypothetical protein
MIEIFRMRTVESYFARKIMEADICLKPKKEFGGQFSANVCASGFKKKSSWTLPLLITVFASATVIFTPFSLTAFRHRKTCLHSNTKL